MSAPFGNANALKWTIEKTQQLITAVDDLSYDTTILYLGQALSALRTSTRQWHRLKSYYADHETIIEHMEAVEQVFEARLISGALTGRLKGNMVQFILRRTQADTEKAEEQIDPAKQMDAFGIPKSNTPAEYNRRVSYVLNHALGLANAMRWNEQNPEAVPIRLDTLYVAEPANSSCIKFAEGVYLQL